MSDQTSSIAAEQPQPQSEFKPQRKAARKHAAKIAQRHGEQVSMPSKAGMNSSVAQVTNTLAATTINDAVKSPEQLKRAIDVLFPGDTRFINGGVKQLEDLLPGARRALYLQVKNANNPQAKIIPAAVPDAEDEVEFDFPVAPLAFLSGFAYKHFITRDLTLNIPSAWGSLEAVNYLFDWMTEATRDAVTGEKKDPKTGERKYQRIHLRRHFQLNLNVYVLAWNLDIPEVCAACVDWFAHMPMGPHDIMYEDLKATEKLLPFRKDRDPVLGHIGRRVARFIREDEDGSWNHEEMRAFLKTVPNLKATVQSYQSKHNQYLRHVEAEKRVAAGLPAHPARPAQAVKHTTKAPAPSPPVNTNVDLSAWANPAFAGSMEDVRRGTTTGQGSGTPASYKGKGKDKQQKE